MKVKRFGVSLEEELLKELDKLVEENHFPNRSQAIRYLVKKSIVEEKWQGNQIVAGAIVLVYDHHKRELLSKSTDIQHDYTDLILSSQHVHLDHHNCLETIAVKGHANRLIELSDRLIGLKGIMHGKLVMSSTL
ncbi:MAG TPA: nickel-responsive transcriptional regulator NikR [Bacteroidales bacterium]|nr:MAG: nickel-responsive regulator [Bacteroidetes bacterium GWF2_33_38]OFY68666.1 MAG: nickel-responsive regulator [Bacteroidetes bacterium RIFOXYA12_FULL_33_9]HBF89075.1 nickel-responsive transcriptional regulator NikR [Bacteroidales bacterium]